MSQIKRLTTMELMNLTIRGLALSFKVWQGYKNLIDIVSSWNHIEHVLLMREASWR